MNIFLIFMLKEKFRRLSPKNHVVAYDQFFIGGNRYLENETTSSDSGINISQNKESLSLKGQNFKIIFNKKTGALTEIDGEEI